MSRAYNKPAQRLYVDQHGYIIYASTVKELAQKAGGGTVFKIYEDRKDAVVHVGYGVGQRWFNMYTRVELPA